MYPQEYIQFLTHFHGDRDYFECHEILEELWKRTDLGNKDSSWVGLILLAVSTYHHRRGNYKGAKRTIEKAMKIFETPANLGLDFQQLNNLLTSRLALINTDAAYTSFELPICDPALLEVCKKSCASAGFLWGQESDTANISLIHRHKLRDRTDVIRERDQSLKRRKGSE
jgi:hypothetical protein